MLAASIFVWTLVGYALAGVMFAVWFVVTGITDLDNTAEGSGKWFRLFVFPGAAAFWPLLAYRVLIGKKMPVETNAHRRAARTEEGR